jgi:acyl-CoA dehydrogenase
MVLLARTAPLGKVKKPSERLSLFFIDSDKSQPRLELKKIRRWEAEQ